ncbi:MAG: zinc-dependent metalloprotease, partial [Bacteroidota bacterium]
GQVINQYQRYMGHVSNNIGGVYELYKTADQDGAVYLHVARDHQKNCMEFMQKHLFETPQWLIDKTIFDKIQYSGYVERIRSVQERYLNNMLHLGKMARIIENETLNGKEAYGLLEMMTDLRNGIWSETKSGKVIDTYRRNLQKAYVDRLAYLMTAGNQKKLPDFNGYRKSTVVNTSQSDIRSVARAELNNLKRDIRNGLGRTSDRMSRYHLQDVLERIDLILNPS